MYISSRTKIVAAAGVALFAMGLMIFQYFYADLFLRRQAEQNSRKIAALTANELANSVKRSFTEGIHLARSFTQSMLVFRKYDVPRSEIYSMMKASLSKSENILAIWTMWEKNSYDGDDFRYRNDGFHDQEGRLNTTFYLDSGRIMMETADTSTYSDDYFALPKRYRNMIIIDPYSYQYKGNPRIFYETSVINPLIENGAFLGVIGIDIDLKFLQESISNTKNYDKFNIILTSGTGLIVTNKYPEYIGKHISEYIGSTYTSLADSIKQIKSFNTTSISEVNGKNVIRYYFPIKTGGPDLTWYVVVEIPESEVYRSIASLGTFAIIILTATLFLLMYLIFNIFYTRKRESYLIKSLQTIEISEQKIMESLELVSRSEKILEAAFNQNLSLAGLVSVDGSIIRYNKPALDFLKMSDREATGKLFSEYSWWKNDPSSHLVLTTAVDNAKKGISIITEVEYTGSDGRRISFLLSVKPIFGSDSEILFILPEAIDITKTKETERELMQYRNMLEEMVAKRTEEVHQLNYRLFDTNRELLEANARLKSQKEELSAALKNLHDAQEKLIISEKMASLGLFTSGIAHEINNPVNFISAGTHGLFEQLEKLEAGPLGRNREFMRFMESARVFTESIRAGVTRTTEIISSLRNYSGSNTGKFVCFDIEKCIKDSLIILRNLYKHRITVIEDFGGGCEIDCIPGKMNQVFVNLLTNAIDSIQKEGTIEISTIRSGDNIIVRLKDSGTGIADEDIHRIFDPFFTTKPHGKGVGLGLYIVYGIIEQHKGKIEISSSPGIGTTVTLTLPVRQS